MGRASVVKRHCWNIFSNPEIFLKHKFPYWKSVKTFVEMFPILIFSELKLKLEKSCLSNGFQFSFLTEPFRDRGHPPIGTNW